MDRKTLKESWLNELKTTRNNRDGIGMYTLDTFDDELASGLAECSKVIMAATLMSVYDICNREDVTSKEDVKSIILKIVEEMRCEKETSEENLEM